MKKFITFGLITASSIVLAACNQGAATNGTAANASANKAAPANAAAPAPAPAGNSAGATGGGEQADATNQNFTILNNTGQAIRELYVSAVSVDNWEEDVLGRDVLPNGEQTTVTFDRAETECQWDLRVVLEDGNAMEERNVNLCQTAAIVVAP